MSQLEGHWTRRTVVSLPVASLAATVTAAPASAAAAPEPAAEGTAAWSTPWPGARPPTVLMTPATTVAARSDRRPVAGGVYDRRANTTFITWGGQFQDNYIQAYHHRRRTWSAPVKVGTGGGDAHNYPTIVQADDGHLLVFRGVHNTELRVARSPRPHSIEGVWTDTVIPQGFGATYPMPFRTARGAIFVFVRETARDFDPTYPSDTRPIKYVRSIDHGRTWRSSGELTGDRWNIAPLDRPDNMNEIYLGQMRYEPASRGLPERITMVYTLAGGGPEGTLHDRYHRNIYYAYFTPRDLSFRAADGRSLGTRVDAVEQEHLKVAETPLQNPFPRSPDYISLVGDVFGRPLVLWMQYDATGGLHTHAGVYTPFGWRSAEIAAGVRVRTMERVDGLTWRVYATPADGTTGILTFLLFAGVFWHPESLIPTPKPVQRIEVIGNYRDPARILATGASSARDVAIADGDIYVAGAPR